MRAHTRATADDVRHKSTALPATVHASADARAVKAARTTVAAVTTQTRTLLLEAGDDLAHEAALHAVGLHRDERALHGERGRAMHASGDAVSQRQTLVACPRLPQESRRPATRPIAPAAASRPAARPPTRHHSVCPRRCRRGQCIASQLQHRSRNGTHTHSWPHLSGCAGDAVVGGDGGHGEVLGFGLCVVAGCRPREFRPA